MVKIQKLTILDLDLSYNYLTNHMNTLKTYSINHVVDKIINVGNGTYYYNFNIEPTRIKGFTEAEDTEGYSYNQVVLTSSPTYKDCVKEIIRAYISVDEEFDLINTANKALMGLLSEEEKEVALEKYKDYLDLVSDIKEKVRKDFPES